MEPLLKVENIKKTYGKSSASYTALENISFDIHEGEFVGIMGPSGAGKSTLLNMLATIDSPTEGKIYMNDTSIHDMSGAELTDFRRDNLGFIFQDYNLLDSLTVKENILLPLAIAKIPAKEITILVNRIAKVFGIEGLLAKYPYQISGGQKQRTAAARALVTEPALILADEPTGALDSKSATGLLESLSELNENNNSTIMLVTHDAYAASFCRRIIFIKDGTLSTEIYRRGRTRKAFFQEILDVLATIGGEVDDVI
ncbi:ABC transporter ATP-binding protein [Peribacillus simplex]|uniref:ABC transporter ATP-binding protein n=1 Tax=Peribacillus TaxID=2675229 RepID=UPI000776BC2A|nr:MULTISPECIES: ABC transporter ATP-binding protein [Peribacillus]AMM91762.1 bacitracin ABC transporter ATP-binding protein [Peribacillus simplex]MDF9763357.1 putative ABC transport system ATP-binding protein [Peribacillus simplex]MDM5296283.1 ABC transporter ATP-binding protein [Peribacillus simplex]MDV7766523.1 ABC transporter ATP-binding protein [Peribacillus sp. CSMR9]